ncbi:MAG: helix-turn-helix domain-containing protein [Bacilli bacterium]|nr:helix-turn-helix domain-containing protein [Bacilli bacterium]
MAYKVLGDRIKKIRLDNNMTQQEFAEALGYTHKSMINKIETGQTDISFDVVLRLIMSFKVNANEFLDLSIPESEELMAKAEKIDKPDWRKIHPLKSRDESVVYVRPTVIDNPNIVVGEYTYFDGQNFQRHVTHHYDFIGDKLIIGKFCQIGRGVEFIMNGANHQMNSASTYPFYIFNGWKQESPKKEDLPYKGDTIIGNDVWIGQNVTFLPGVHVGDGCIVGANSVVGSDISPYSVAVGNPARVIRKRFDDEMIGLLEKLKWWNKPTSQIQKIIPLLSNSDAEYVKEEIKYILKSEKALLGHGTQSN